MQQFDGKVAVITGAASGIGFALAERAGRERMTVIMADIEASALDEASTHLSRRGYTVVPHQLNVTREADVEDLAGRVFEAYGGVHLLCNNAGVMTGEKAAWEFAPEDWHWTLSVNLWGVINGVRAFVPRMLASGDEGHVVNTASMAGLITGRAGNAIYDASKHAVLSLSESLYRDLIIRQTKVSASVLCPGAVLTKIFEAERNRPEELGGGKEPVVAGETAFPGNSFQPEEMANQVFDAVRNDRFYVLGAQREMIEWTKMGHDRMFAGKNPAVSHRLLAMRDAGHPLGQ
ncbi:MAG: SDR family NAD(P)-dependent oxidoreductase [Dehalococcoidia bacterium]